MCQGKNLHSTNLTSPRVHRVCLRHASALWLYEVQELPCLGPGLGGSAMSTTSDESEGMHAHLPSPGRRHVHSVRDDKTKPATPSKLSSKAQSALAPAVSLDSGIARSHRTRDRDRGRERNHDRTKSVVRFYIQCMNILCSQ